MSNEVLLLIIFFGVMGFAILLAVLANYGKDDGDDE